MQNIFQAQGALKAKGQTAIPGKYPEVDAGWPNRKVRRAIKHNRWDRLPAGWAQVLTANPELTKRIKGLN